MTACLNMNRFDSSCRQLKNSIIGSNLVIVEQEGIPNLKNRKQFILGVIRAPFLILAPACVFLGAGAVVWNTGSINFLYLLLALIGAVSAHISVNAINEYYDFKSGLDLVTRRTPFSGGSGSIPAHPEDARLALIIGLGALALTGLIGIIFLLVWGWELLPLGLLGMVLIYTYTNWINRSPLLSLISPGLGFGTLMVMGTYFALTGEYTWTAFAASFVPFFLVNNLLFLNQFPDKEADKSIGRKNFVILLGRKKSALIYNAFLVLTYLSIIIGVLAGLMPAWTLLGLLTIVLAVQAASTAMRHADDFEKLLPALGQNVLINLLTPTLMAIGFLIAHFIG